MPPTLDLSGATHPNMLVSPPRINLRRTASYNHDKSFLSSTSSRFNFNHLLVSPPPSPGLPALVPQPRRASNTPRPSRVVRLVLWLSGAAVLFYLAVAAVLRSGLVSSVPNWPAFYQEEYEMVGQRGLPDFPTPIVLTDRWGRAKWTVSIPPTYDFPLTIPEYTDVTSKCREVARQVRSLHHGAQGVQQTLLGDSADAYFLDVGEAEKAGLLPGIVANGQQAGGDGGLIGENKDSLVSQPACERTMTFVLESADAGLGKTLMMLWTAYGLAQKEGRSFFVDDTRWAYGQYTDIFQTPPVPSCRPPPRHEMLPCPRQARHLVASAATTKDVFGAAFHNHDDGPARMSSHTQRSMFDLARRGYEALARLNSEDAEYVHDRVRDLTKQTRTDAKSSDGMIVGVHIRHGDRHPIEFQYRDAYIPTNVFTERARGIIDDKFNATWPTHSEDQAAKAHSYMVFASDDPMVYEEGEFAGSFRAQERIRLAHKQAIQNLNPEKNVMHKYVDDTFGWEGGFFAAMFWNLGVSSMTAANAAAKPESKLPPPAETLRLRNLVGRAYVMDLAVLAELSDTVVCAVSAMGCRLLAVMMGWESAMVRNNWVNIDGHEGWTGAFW